MTNSIDGIFNKQKVDTGIVFGNGQRLKTVYIGDKKGIIIQKNGARVPILMKNVKYVPHLYCNLFSISAALKEGCTLEGNLNKLMLTKKGQNYVFDRRVKSGKGFLFAMKVKNIKKSSDFYKLSSQKTKNKRSELMTVHRILGHPSETITRASGLKFG